MAQGTVKWFNPDKGFGFIAPDDGGEAIVCAVDAITEFAQGMDQRGLRSAR